MKRFLLLLAVAVVLSGCGKERRIDGSSEKAFDRSVDPIIKSLPEDEAKKVFSGMSSIIMSESFRLKGKGNVFQVFDGMTESEFIEFAKTKKKPSKQ